MFTSNPELKHQSISITTKSCNCLPSVALLPSCPPITATSSGIMLLISMIALLIIMHFYFYSKISEFMDEAFIVHAFKTMGEDGVLNVKIMTNR